MSLTGPQILESISLGILITDLNGRIIGVNSALCELLGYDKAELDGNVMSSLFAETGSSGSQGLLNDVTRGKGRVPHIADLVARDGEQIPVEIHPGVVYDPTGSKVGALFTIKNLSEEMKLLKTVQRRNMQLLASSEVAKVATQIHEVQELLLRCVDLIRTHFGFYYAAIFLIDETGEWAFLRAATGEAGHRLLEDQHKLGVGSQSMVGWVTANNAARIALDVGQEAVRFDNPLLPKTRSEMALPLRVRGEVIGALDVQSTSLNAFADEDVQTIQMMADQVAIAIDNAHLFAQQIGEEL
ncbi:MAG: GAF domain-containing protein [Anaerolineae bacterium]|nr:GAF domain-containing protein [Anaerolineae bacterium]